MRKTVWVLLVAFFSGRIVRRRATFDAILPTGNHARVFLYLSDFSRLKMLNPTVTEVCLVERKNKGNVTLKYWEFLHQVPFVKNEGTASYQIQWHRHRMISHHTTSFFYDLLNLSTDSTLKISKNSDQEVGYKETIDFECPWIFIQFCIREITYQRTQIIRNLRKIISTDECTQLGNH